VTAVVLVACGLTIGSWVAVVALLAHPSTDGPTDVPEDDSDDPGGP